MSSTRRGFLAGVTALAGGLAGCNESPGGAVDGTVTPVEVPRTDGEILREVAAIQKPTIPPSAVVDDAHLESAIAHLDRLRRSLVEAAGSREEPLEDAPQFGRGSTPADTVEQVEERIRQARETGPSRDALEALHATLGDVARWVGYLRADSGDLTMADVEDDLAAERAAVRGLRDDLEYRVAVPVTDNLPTVHAAEETLLRLGDDDRWGVQPAEGEGVGREEESPSDLDPTPTPEPDPDPEHVAHRYYRLERTRRHRDDVERYLGTATDEGAPSIRGDLERRLAEVRTELEPIAAEYRGGEDQPGGGSVAEDLGEMRWSVGNRTHRYLSRTPAAPPDGDLVRVLFEGVRRLVSFHAIDAGVERTLERLDGRRFPTGTLLEEKQRAVENLEHAAEQPALHRAFAGRAEQVLDSADRYGHRDEANVEQVARMHALYVAAAEWADRGVSRAEATSASLQAQQS